jgi:hypothetical protein
MEKAEKFKFGHYLPSNICASRRTGPFPTVLDFVLVSSKNLGLLTYAENVAENYISPTKSTLYWVWQVMASNGLKWLKVDF